MTNQPTNKVRTNSKLLGLLAAMVLGTAAAVAQDDRTADGLTSAMAIVTAAAQQHDTATVTLPAAERPLWKQKLYYGYNFDIYFHHDSRTDKRENGWSFALTPELGWRLKENVYMGLRIGGTFQDLYTTYSYKGVDGEKYSEDLRVMLGSWEVTPYVRYRLKTLFNDKIGIWLEAHLYTGMNYPRVKEGSVAGTDYDGLRHSLTYGAQVSPVITYQFNSRSSFQIFFSIMSFGYSGTTRFYEDPKLGRYCEYSNDVIIFSGKLRNLIANQFTPGLYGLKFGIQKSF